MQAGQHAIVADIALTYLKQDADEIADHMLQKSGAGNSQEEARSFPA